MFILKFFILLFTFSNFNTIPIYPNSNNHEVSSIAFGSCFKTYNLGKDNKIFKAVKDKNPDLWVWLGDTAYLDNLNFKLSKFEEDYIKNHVETVFNYSKNNKEYQNLIKTTKIIGIWDDHDFGEDDGGFEFIHKEVIKQLFLNFLDEPLDSPRRKLGVGLQASYSFGHGVKSVKIILLDNRYYSPNIRLIHKIKDFGLSFINRFYDSKDTEFGGYSILGEEQWIYLENELESSKETIIIIGLGIQFLAFNKGLNEAINFSDRKRLFYLISKHKKSGVMFITGDIHHGQIQRTFCIIEDIGYHIHEFTSSGLTHNCVINFILDVDLCQFGWDYLLPHEYNILPTMQEFNFGMINIDWGNNKKSENLEENALKDINITIELINNQGEIKRTHSINYYNELRFQNISNDNFCKLQVNFYGFRGIFFVFSITLLNKFFGRVLSLIILLFLIVSLSLLCVIFFSFKIFKFMENKYIEKNNSNVCITKNNKIKLN